MKKSGFKIVFILITKGEILDHNLTFLHDEYEVVTFLLALKDIQESLILLLKISLKYVIDESHSLPKYLRRDRER